jgi:hypothetical protein
VRIPPEVGVFVGICAVFVFIGAASAPDEPGLAASRMARKAGAPLALLFIGAAELGLALEVAALRAAGGPDRGAVEGDAVALEDAVSPYAAYRTRADISL